jgi:hypothetical protein
LKKRNENRAYFIVCIAKVRWLELDLNYLKKDLHITIGLSIKMYLELERIKLWKSNKF